MKEKEKLYTMCKVLKVAMFPAVYPRVSYETGFEGVTIDHVLGLFTSPDLVM